MKTFILVLAAVWTAAGTAENLPLQLRRRSHPVAQKPPRVKHGSHCAPGSSQERY
jgi:hypothetical protein